MNRVDFDMLLVRVAFPDLNDTSIFQTMLEDDENTTVLSMMESGEIEATNDQLEAVRQLTDLYLSTLGNDKEDDEVPKHMNPVESSNIKAIQLENDKLYVLFKGDSMYRYDDVTLEEYNSIVNPIEGSVGKALQAFKKLGKPYKKIK
jgi:hypothetical protein